VRQTAEKDLANLIWKYYQGEQTEPFDKMLLLSLEAKKFELAIELLKLHMSPNLLIFKQLRSLV
jgi:hypothetical protein